MKYPLIFLCATMAWGGPLGGHYYESVSRYRGHSAAGGTRMVYVRTICDKVAPGQFTGRTVIRVYDILKFTEVSGIGLYEFCPAFADVALALKENFAVTHVKPIPPPADERAATELIQNPDDTKIFLANSLGPRGRSSFDVVDAESRQIVANVDVEDRLFAGVAFNAKARRAYALFFPSTSPPAPAHIAYIDTSTNRVVDRWTLPDLLDPQKPALSRDGKFLYVAARTGTGFHQVHVLDLQSKRIVGTFPTATASVFAAKAVSLSPDERLLCASTQAAIAFYDVASRTLLARVAASPPNSQLRPVFHPSGHRVYTLVRAFVGTSLMNYVLVIDTPTMTEVTRIPILKPAPADFRDSTVAMSITPDGGTLIVDEGSRGVLNIVDTKLNRIIRTEEGQPTGLPGAAILLRE